MRFPASPPRANNTSLGTHTPGTGALPLCKRTPRVQILFPCVRRPLTQKQPSCKRTSLVPTRSPHVQKHPKPPQPAPALPGGLPVSPSLPVDPPLPGPSLTHLRRPTPGQHPRVQGGGSWGCGAAAGVAAHDLWGGGRPWVLPGLQHHGTRLAYRSAASGAVWPRWRRPCLSFPISPRSCPGSLLQVRVWGDRCSGEQEIVPKPATKPPPPLKCMEDHH